MRRECVAYYRRLLKIFTSQLCVYFSEMDLQAQLQMNQSRIDDITLKEDLPNKSNNMGFGNDFGVRDYL